MPIGDLLASITGEATAPASGSKPSPLTSPHIKRRAEDDGLDHRETKIARTNSTGARRVQVPQPSSAPTSTSEKVHGPGNIEGVSAILASRLSRLSASASDGRPAMSKPGSELPTVNKQQSQATRLVAASPVVQDTRPKSEPKKGSFKEIMARAAAAKEMRPALGRISHKTVGKSTVSKERSDAPNGLATTKIGSSRSQSRVTGSSSLARLNPRQGAVAARGRRHSRNTTGKVSTSASRKGTSSPQPEKVKKAALATTGYTGTARPPPSASSSKPTIASYSNTGSKLPEQSLTRRVHVSRQRGDEDEDMDDFIEYDDEEDQDVDRGRSTRYGSADEESDMEAGISDIDEEEWRTEYIARKEDKKEERLERELKRKKEERKRGR